MTTKPFDLARAMANGGRCQTRDGRPARIICTDINASAPIAAVVRENGEHESVWCYHRGGGWWDSGNSPHDLVNIPEKRSGFANVYRVRGGVELHYHDTREEADANKNWNRVACIPIEWEE